MAVDAGVYPIAILCKLAAQQLTAGLTVAFEGRLSWFGEGADQVQEFHRISDAHN